MKKAEILKIIEKIESMRTITSVKIKSEDFEITIEKENTQSVRRERVVPSIRDNKPATKAADNGKASPFQVKYARDLMTKVFGTDERMALDFLAHTLEVPMGEVPDIATWDDSLTVDMVSSILDALQPMHSKSRTGSDF